MKTKQLHTDTLGLAYTSYFEGNDKAYFTLLSPHFDPDDVEVAHFFRNFNAMPPIEQRAIEECKGRILDVGAGTGTHSLELQKRGFQVTALDISPLACAIMSKRGISKVVCEDFYTHAYTTYHTILFLMNGIGIVGTLEGFPQFFESLSRILEPGGQVLVDSSDLRYLFEEDDGSFAIPLCGYYGELEYTVEFEQYTSQPFPWVYVDFDTLASAAESAGWNCTLVTVGEHYDFLARLTRK
ncbi:MAG: Methyltransferase domain protein [Bacteroidetes bacterium ADurb.Bin217]|nr:MAG: Methyltransferase domain protein [Bacteroidetes bacterium ADurb.Bin217]